MPLVAIGPRQQAGETVPRPIRPGALEAKDLEAPQLDQETPRVESGS